MGFSLRFWGVRGSIATPSAEHVQYGGNTSCIEVKAGDQTVILDAGTGLRELGRSFQAAGPKRSTLLLTHTHWDHINGFPFFAPLYQPGRHFRIMAGHLADVGGVKAVLAGQMAGPMFPVPLDALKAGLDFEDFRSGDRFDLSTDVHVRTSPLNHPNGATGYRIEHAGRALCYVTDTEHIPRAPDQNILELIEGADVVIYDSTYTEKEFGEHIGWGHSTWEEGVRLCRSANAKRLAIFHHDPSHDDTFMAQVEAEAKKTWDATFVAREGMTVEL